MSPVMNLEFGGLVGGGPTFSQSYHPFLLMANWSELKDIDWSVLDWLGHWTLQWSALMLQEPSKLPCTWPLAWISAQQTFCLLRERVLRQVPVILQSVTYKGKVERSKVLIVLICPAQEAALNQRLADAGYINIPASLLASWNTSAMWWWAANGTSAFDLELRAGLICAFLTCSPVAILTQGHACRFYTISRTPPWALSWISSLGAL